MENLSSNGFKSPEIYPTPILRPSTEDFGNFINIFERAHNLAKQKEAGAIHIIVPSDINLTTEPYKANEIMDETRFDYHNQNWTRVKHVEGVFCCDQKDAQSITIEEFEAKANSEWIFGKYF